MQEMEMPTTLDECAASVAQQNLDLQRQTAAYRYFEQVLKSLHKVVDGTASDKERLPFISFNYPDSITPSSVGIFKLDLNTLSPDEIRAIIPVYEMLVGTCAERLILAWDRLAAVMQIAAPKIAAAKGAACPA